MAGPNKRTSLACLKKKRLILLVRELGLDVAATEPKDTLVDAIARAKSTSLQGLLEHLSLAERRQSAQSRARQGSRPRSRRRMVDRDPARGVPVRSAEVTQAPVLEKDWGTVTS